MSIGVSFPDFSGWETSPPSVPSSNPGDTVILSQSADGKSRCECEANYYAREKTEADQRGDASHSKWCENQLAIVDAKTKMFEAEQALQEAQETASSNEESLKGSYSTSKGWFSWLKP